MGIIHQDHALTRLGTMGLHKGAKVCRDENFVREPSLKDALAYEAIYGRPVSELFAGLYQQASQDVKLRARLMLHRKVRRLNQRRQQSIIQLAEQLSRNLTNDDNQ